jgi:hypothetical protein
MSANRLRPALVDRAAMQWSALGVALQAPREPTVVDLEALIGLTAAVGAADARVWDGAIAWCGRYGRFVNSARLKGVVVEMGIAGDDLAAFATAARRAGAPPWSLAGEPRPGTPRGESRDDLVVVRPTRDAARLLWVLRAAFGVNARADFRSLTDSTITNLPYNAAGELVNRNGFGTVSGVLPPRTLQLVTRLTF